MHHAARWLQYEPKPPKMYNENIKQYPTSLWNRMKDNVTGKLYGDFEATTYRSKHFQESKF